MTAANHVASPRRQSGRPDRRSLAPTPVRPSPREEAQRVRIARATTYRAAAHHAASIWVKGTAFGFALFAILALILTSGFRQVAMVYGVVALIFAIAFVIAVHIRNKHDWLRDERIRAKRLQPELARQVFDAAVAKAGSGRREPATYDQPTFEVGT